MPRFTTMMVTQSDSGDVINAMDVGNDNWPRVEELFRRNLATEELGYAAVG